MEKKHGLVPVANHPVILGIRGYYRDSKGAKGKNDFGIYDDAMFVCTVGNVTPFEANTDPSKAKKGTAVLRPGVYRYIAGCHRITRPPMYPALRQHSDVVVDRIAEGKDEGQFAINIHRGGDGSTSSLGCQTLHPDVWGEFISIVYKAIWGGSLSYGEIAREVLKSPYGVKGRSCTYVLATREDLEKTLGIKL